MLTYYFLFNKTISLFYSLFVFRILQDYSFIFFKLSGPRACGPRACGPRAYPSLARRYGPGISLKLAGRAGPGMGQTFTVWVGSGLRLGLNSSLRAWAGPGLKNCCGLSRAWTANCGPALGSNYRPAQGTSSFRQRRARTTVRIQPQLHT